MTESHSPGYPLFWFFWPVSTFLPNLDYLQPAIRKRTAKQPKTIR
jgi:hypothetical protein